MKNKIKLLKIFFFSILFFFLGFTSTLAQGGTTLNFEQAAKDQNIPMADEDIGFAVSRIMGFVFQIAALLAFFTLIFGAFEWITSGGDSSKLEKARGKMVWAAIGLIALASVTALFSFIQGFIGVDIIKFGF